MRNRQTTTRAFATLLALAAITTATATAQRWTFLDGPFDSGAMGAFDWARERLVLFGSDGATWEIDGASRVLQRPVPGPPARTRGSMVYDLLRQRVFLFGGQGNGVLLGDTWTFDGVRWTRLLPGTGQQQPQARVDAPIAFDLARDRVVLFGGTAPGGQLTDTWEHDGTRWLQALPTGSPQLGLGTMTYDLGRGVCLLLSIPDVAAFAVTTWEWSGATWQQRVVFPPTVRLGAALAYDLGRGRAVVAGGSDSGAIWEFDGAQWRSIQPATPMPRANTIPYFDPTRGRVVIAGGNDARPNGNSLALGSGHLDAWVWDGAALTPVRADPRPPSRSGHALVADTVRGDVVLFGGIGSNVARDDTWTWNGSTWNERAPAVRPPARGGAAATFDATRGLVLVFGGTRLGGLFDDLWGFDGTTWSLLPAAAAPAPRHSASMAFDAARGELVLFGGATGSSPTSATNETWVWNGTTWTMRQPAVAPQPRLRAAMAFDPVRGRVMLYGGSGGSLIALPLADAWDWDGVQWTSIPTAALGGALTSPSLVHDAAQSRMLLVGTVTVGSTFRTEIWSLAGTPWTRLDATGGLQLGGPFVLDPVRQRLLCDQGQSLAEWSATPATVADVGAGCGSPVPALALRTRARIGAAGFGLETRAGPRQPVLFALADTGVIVPFGNNCTAYVGGTVATVLVPTGRSGGAEMLVPIPADPTLRGLALMAQAAVFDTAAPGGIRLSAGLQVTVGD